MASSKSFTLKFAFIIALGAATGLTAQTTSTRGKVKSATADTLTVTAAQGDITVAVPADAKILQVAPGSTDLKSATPAAISSIAAGDMVLITGTAGDTPASLHATRVIVMKSTAIAQTHAAEAAAWQHGGGGVVKSVNAAAGTIMISSGLQALTIKTSPATQFRRYSGDSVRFEDAVASQLADVRPGDQLRVRGTKSDDGASIQADEIVTGTFRHFSGLLTAIDGTAGTVTLKDLATKKVVVVRISANSDLRRIPAQMAARFAARPAAAGGAAAPAAGGNARAGMDLSQMLSRLPTETPGGLKTGDAVMIVATQPPADSAQPTAVTLLAGVEPILQASPEGETELTPWSVGTEAPEGGGAQ